MSILYGHHTVPIEQEWGINSPLGPSITSCLARHMLVFHGDRFVRALDRWWWSGGLGYGMVWCGMVWYGMVWYGMVWYGMVWYGKELNVVRWHHHYRPLAACGCFHLSKWPIHVIPSTRLHYTLTLDCIPEYRDFSPAKISFWLNLVNLKGTVLQNMPKWPYCWCGQLWFSLNFHIFWNKLVILGTRQFFGRKTMFENFTVCVQNYKDLLIGYTKTNRHHKTLHKPMPIDFRHFGTNNKEDV